MSTTWTADLEDRGVLALTGPDARTMLSGLVTNDVSLIDGEPAIHAALLTPQGKIIADFFIVKANDGYLLDVARDRVEELVKRLKLYKLRAKVEIRDASADFRVIAVWGTSPHSPGDTAMTVSYPDPRLKELGLRILAEARFAADVAAATNGLEATARDYHAHRIALGVPEGGKDYAFGDTFPHEALLDQLHGVSFTKGCYVGQEVVARMQHRRLARKRVVPIVAATDLASGAEVKAGDVAIGAVGSVAATRGLALVRVDRAAEFAAKGIALTAGGVPITIELPAFAGFSLAPAEAQEVP